MLAPDAPAFGAFRPAQASNLMLRARRIVLLLASLVFLAIAAGSLVAPHTMAAQLDYRLEKTAAGWKIYDVNVMGVWLVENYRNSFAQEISAKGIDGLIATLAEKNKAANRS